MSLTKIICRLLYINSTKLSFSLMDYEDGIKNTIVAANICLPLLFFAAHYIELWHLQEEIPFFFYRFCMRVS